MNLLVFLRRLSFFLLVGLTITAVSNSHRAAAQDSCPTKWPKSLDKHFRLDSTGNMVSEAGGVIQVGYSQPAPACVIVVFNALRFNLTVTDKRTTTAGQDPSSVLTTGALPKGAGGATHLLVQSLGTPVTTQQNAVKSVTTAITDLQSLVAQVDIATAGGDAANVLNVAKTQFTAIARDLKNYQSNKQYLIPSDLATGTCSAAISTPVANSLLDQLSSALTQANNDLAKDQVQLKTDTDKLTADRAAGQSTQADQDAINSDNTKIADDNADIATLNSYISQAGLYKCGSAGLQTLTTQSNEIDMWITRLGGLGFGLGPAGAQITATVDVFAKSYPVSCNFLFNSSASDELDSSYSDELPTLNGGTATPGSAAQAFFTFTCAAPIVFSGGIEISGIPDREYQIVKASGGANNTSVNQFGYATNSPVHVLPIVATHIRLGEPDAAGRKLAYWATVGVSGNLQGQQSGGSSAEFLLGPSISFLRTLFLTAGVHIGYESVLVGGFKVGDTVPTDISSPQVSKSLTVRYGIGITFSKP